MNIAYFGYQKAEQPKHTHDYSTFVKTNKQATCTEKGIDIYRCNCGDVTEIETDPKHKLSTKVEGDYEITYCTECELEISKKAVSTNTNTSSDQNITTSTNTNTTSSTNNTTSQNVIKNTVAEKPINETKNETKIENET